MTTEPTENRQGFTSTWKMAGLVAGSLAVGYALVQERERMSDAVANMQDTLTNNGLNLMQKLSEIADAFLVKVHETFVAAAPPKNFDPIVRHGLTGRSDDAATTSVPQQCHRAPKTRRRENDTSMDDENMDDENGDENADDPAYQPKESHRKRRTRYRGPEQNGTTSRHCSSRAAGATALSGGQASLQAQEAGEDNPMTLELQSNEPAAATLFKTVRDETMGDESDVLGATVVLPEAKEMYATPPIAIETAGDTHIQDAYDKLVSVQTRTVAQRAQVEPASLLGARLSAVWVNETFTCEVIMIRKGQGDKFEALVKYETDGVEQWEVIGEPPYMHTLIAEPVDMWLRTGSALIDAHTLERMDSREYEGVVMAWLPKRDGLESLYKIYHMEDGDFEELDETEVTAAIALFVESANVTINKT